ncbi:MAG: heme-binding protein [Chromatiaceae bacterium]|jgi:hypothetical protein|nr:MAG: heme-binding protein [Chromatiaceae bacterium]
MKIKLLLAAAALLALLFLASALLNLDEPTFTLMERGDDFELRRYEPFMVAETEIEGAFAASGAPAFRVLLDYIKGNNQGGRNIPMTAPVNQQAADAAAAGGDNDRSGRWRYQFVMPKEYLPSMLPQPADQRVSLRLVPGRLLAARRYRGDWSEARYREQEAKLLTALDQARLQPVGEPIFARYNAPFIPGFLRRNEVLVQVRDPAPATPAP